jgi:hypothetical protein
MLGDHYNLKLGQSYCRSTVDILIRKKKVERKDLRTSTEISLYKVLKEAD